MKPKNTPPLTLGILGSGSGSNFQAIADAIDAGRLHARIACVISDQPEAGILDRARSLGIPAMVESCAPFRTKLDGDAQTRVIARLRQTGVDTVVLAGFMRMLKTGLLEAFPGRILNVHPALLPAFPGLHAWTQALHYGAKVSGCTVHFVDAGMDTGPIIHQRAVPVLDTDTPESLHTRIQQAEHEAFPQALQWLAENRLHIEGRHVRCRPPINKESARQTSDASPA